MPIGEIDPVIYGSLPGYIVSGYQTSATTVASGSVNAGDQQEFFVIEQSLDIDYVRKRDFYTFASETSSYSLSGASTIQFIQPSTMGTRLYCRVKAYTRGYRALLDFSGNYNQNQIFAVYPNSNDVYGQNYGPVSAGSGILSSVKLGPGGIIRTVVPGYQRFLWSSVSGYGTSAFPASGWNQTIDAYNFAISMDDCIPAIVTLASGVSGNSTNTIGVPLLSGLGANFYLGAPTFGNQWKKESQLMYDPMYTYWPGYSDNNFTFTKKSPETILDHGSFMYGNYSTSNEPNIIARTFINNIGTAVSTPFGYSSPYNKICYLYNSELYWNSDIQILYGVPYGKYVGGISIAAPVMDRYRSYLHSM